MLLINVCCGPCGLPILEHLKNVSGEVTLYFYGPNIYPAAEYQRRLTAARAAAENYGLKLIEGEYDHDAWLLCLKEDLDMLPGTYDENGERCQACFDYRLKQTATFARDNGFAAFGSTLSVSRFKDVSYINQLGARYAGENELAYQTFPLEAGAAHRLGLELSRRYNLYRQKYCGCEFSLNNE